MVTPNTENYRYSLPGTRLHKSGVQHTQPQHQIRYLAGLEKRQNQHTHKTGEILLVITLANARIYYWQQGKPANVHLPLIRYAAPDRNGSCLLETDQKGGVISCEVFYPYGGSALWLSRSQEEASYKYWRYVSKEHDITGLIYYGFRYYAAWLMRWINPDPAGVIDGINHFAMVGNNPVTFSDVDGRVRTQGTSVFITAREASVMKAWNTDDAAAREAISQVFLQTNFTGKVEDLIQGASLEIPSAENVHHCFHENCRAQFTHSKSYDQHLEKLGRREHDDKIWSCDWMDCGKLFRHHNKLRRHQQAHEKKSDFHCDVAGCSASFNTLQAKYQHVKRKHPCTSSYVCTQANCDQHFDTPQQRRNHLVTEHKPTSIVCNECPTPKTFSNQYNLKEHMKKHQTDMPVYPCLFSGCDKKYSNYQSLRRHQKQKHKPA